MDIHLLKGVPSLNLNPEVDFRLYGRHLIIVIVMIIIRRDITCVVYSRVRTRVPSRVTCRYATVTWICVVSSRPLVIVSTSVVTYS